MITIFSHQALIATLFVMAVSLQAGCVGIQTDGEQRARQDQESVGRVYRPDGSRPTLPMLDTKSPLVDFLHFAMLNQPQVEAAYYEWAAAVQRITVERSLPDPRLTFQTDIAGMLTSLMTGLMIDLPGSGKLKWAAKIATAESEAKYFAFENALLQAAFALKKSYYELLFIDAKVRVNRETLRLVRK